MSKFYIIHESIGIPQILHHSHILRILIINIILPFYHADLNDLKRFLRNKIAPSYQNEDAISFISTTHMLSQQYKLV